MSLLSKEGVITMKHNRYFRERRERPKGWEHPDWFGEWRDEDTERW